MLTAKTVRECGLNERWYKDDTFKRSRQHRDENNVAVKLERKVSQYITSEKRKQKVTQVGWPPLVPDTFLLANFLFSQ